MVMCLGYTEETHHVRTPSKDSLVYFPSQDAICASVIPRGVNMWQSGTKRKLEAEEEAELSYLDQRQSVLNISMIKLHTQPIRKVEPPLRRSVLIFNTLKNIETELKLEGVRWNPPSKPSLLPALQPNDDTLDPLSMDTTLLVPNTKTAITDKLACSNLSVECGVHSQNGPVQMDSTPALPCTSGISKSDNFSSHPSGSATTNATSNPQDTVVTSSVAMTTQDSNSLLSDTRSILDFFSNSSSLFNVLTNGQQGSLPTFSSLLDLDSSGSSGSSSSYSATSASMTWSSSSPRLPVLSSASSSPSLTSSAVQPTQHSIIKTSPSISSALSSDSHPTQFSGQYQSSLISVSSSMEREVLADSDFSSLDLDFFSFLPTSLKLPPLSAEDLQSLPHPETFPQSRTTSCNPKHTDLHGDDLDSIMQILVGI